jgi:hypothetical protein
VLEEQMRRDAAIDAQAIRQWRGFASHEGGAT